MCYLILRYRYFTLIHQGYATLFVLNYTHETDLVLFLCYFVFVRGLIHQAGVCFICLLLSRGKAIWRLDRKKEVVGNSSSYEENSQGVCYKQPFTSPHICIVTWPA